MASRDLSQAASGVRDREVSPAILARRPTAEQYVREALGLPGEWRWMIMRAEGDGPKFWGQTLEGGVCPPITRGKNKGRPSWDRATLKRKMTVPDAALSAWLVAWEREMGACHKCEGTGESWAGWSATHGTRYETCRRCGGTGLPSTPSLADTSERQPQIPGSAQ